MLEITVIRTITRPQYQVISNVVKLNGRDKLTPAAARAALKVAFGNDDSGVVYDYAAGYGYRVYAKSARKITSIETE